jgi:hypothetical protein
MAGTGGGLGYNYTHLSGAGTTTILAAIGSAAGAAGGTLQAPGIGAVTTSTTGGTLAIGPYFYKVTALTASGETTPSGEGTVTTTTATASNTVNWNPVPGAIGYRVYRGTAAGAENTYFQVGTVSTFLDTGTAGTAATPPTTNTATFPATPANQGILGNVSVNTAGTSVTINDGTAVLAVIGAVTGPFLSGPTQLKSGLSVTIVGAADVTVAWV